MYGAQTFLQETNPVRREFLGLRPLSTFDGAFQQFEFRTYLNGPNPATLPYDVRRQAARAQISKVSPEISSRSKFLHPKDTSNWIQDKVRDRPKTSMEGLRKQVRGYQAATPKLLEEIYMEQDQNKWLTAQNIEQEKLLGVAVDTIKSVHQRKRELEKLVEDLVNMCSLALQTRLCSEKLAERFAILSLEPPQKTILDEVGLVPQLVKQVDPELEEIEEENKYIFKK